jgi:hypothetical protein
MNGINAVLLQIAKSQLAGTTKEAFVQLPGGVKTAAPAAPPMDPAMMGAPPMDPAMMGAPPMDPSMMPAAVGMDPAAAMAGAGMPVDPAMAMAGGAPGAAPIDPMTGMPMDPAAMGGDPAAAGGQPAIDPALQAAIDESIAKAMGGAGGGGAGGEKPKGSGSGKVDPAMFGALQSDVSEMKGMLHKVTGYLMGAGRISPEEGQAMAGGLGEGDVAASSPAPVAAEPAEKVASSKNGDLIGVLAYVLGHR